MDYSIESLKLVIESNGGIASAKKIAEEGISRIALYQALISGEIAKESHGNYILTNNQPDEYFMIQNRSPKIVFSHGTALFLQGLSDSEPHELDITVPQGDYSKQKIISGKIIPENTEYLIGTPTTYEELLGGDYTGADWDVVPTNNKVNIGTSDEKKKDLLNQFLEIAKTYTDQAIQLRDIQNQAYLNGLEKYFNDSEGLVIDEDTGKVKFKDQASTIATAVVQHQKKLDQILETYQQEINSFAQIIRSFITPNREIKE